MLSSLNPITRFWSSSLALKKEDDRLNISRLFCQYLSKDWPLSKWRENTELEGHRAFHCFGLEPSHIRPPKIAPFSRLPGVRCGGGPGEAVGGGGGGEPAGGFGAGQVGGGPARRGGDGQGAGPGGRQGGRTQSGEVQDYPILYCNCWEHPKEHLQRVPAQLYTYMRMLYSEVDHDVWVLGNQYCIW